MWRASLIVLLLAACAPLPPTPEDIQAKKFEPAQGKAVIYLVRPNLDFSNLPASMLLDERIRVITYPGTYYRWEAPPGPRRISGAAGTDNAVITVQAEPGRIYFVEQSVMPTGFTQYSHLVLVDDRKGRELVLRGELVRSY